MVAVVCLGLVEVGIDHRRTLRLGFASGPAWALPHLCFPSLAHISR